MRRRKRLFHAFEKSQRTPVDKFMKFCPTCQTRYDEEILKFCTKDGTALVEEAPPQFTELPSESVGEDFGEETIVRRKAPTPVSLPGEDRIEQPPPRIVIPTTEEKEPLPPPVRATTTVSHRRQPPQKTNTGKVVLLTVLGTLTLLAGAGGIFWILNNQNSNNADKNINANFNSIDTNLNTNLNIDNSFANFNVNANIDTNLNANLKTNTNANAKTPTPTPKPTASPTPTANANVNANNSNLATPTASPRPTVSPTASPQSSPSVLPTNRPVNAGVLNGRAVSLPKPAYPPIARQIRASGQVSVQVLVDEGGNVLSAKAVSGHPTLRAPAEAAARQSRFNPVKVGDRNVQATGILLYNFINQ